MKSLIRQQDETSKNNEFCKSIRSGLISKTDYMFEVARIISEKQNMITSIDFPKIIQPISGKEYVCIYHFTKIITNKTYENIGKSIYLLPETSISELLNYTIRSAKNVDKTLYMVFLSKFIMRFKERIYQIYFPDEFMDGTYCCLIRLKGNRFDDIILPE